MDIKKIIELFVQNFVLKNRQERVLHELINETKRPQFVHRLNHNWEEVLDMKHLLKIPTNQNDFLYAKKELLLQDISSCYVISNYNDIDGQMMEFKDAFDKCYGRGLATLIINLSGNKIYLETEIEYGSQNRFIGKIR